MCTFVAENFVVMITELFLSVSQRASGKNDSKKNYSNKGQYHPI